MSLALKAGSAYFAIVFCAGFLLGTMRVLALVPHVGEVIAVAIELPVMLIVSWIVCAWLIARLSVPRDAASRLAMGGLAFGLLMAAEIGVSILGFGRTMAEHMETYRHATALLGLLGQLAFALFPLVQLRAGSGRAGGGSVPSRGREP